MSREETVRRLREISTGNRAAVDEVLPGIYGEMRAIAARLFRRADWHSTLGAHRGRPRGLPASRRARALGLRWPEPGAR